MSAAATVQLVRPLVMCCLTARSKRQPKACSAAFGLRLTGNVRSQVALLRITKNGEDLCAVGSDDVWTFSASVWADIWGPEVSSITVTGSRPSAEGAVGEFLVWRLAHELEANDCLQFSFLEGSESSPLDDSPLDDSPVENASEGSEKIDFFAPLPESELLKLEARPVENAHCEWSFRLGKESPLSLGPDLARQHVSLHLLWNDRRPERLRVNLSRSSLREISRRAKGEELYLEYLPLGSQFELQLGPNPSIERTSQRPLRALCAAAHVER